MLYSAACLLLLASIAFAGTPSAGLTKRQSDSCDIGYAVCLPDVSGTNADPYSVVYDDTYTLIYALLGIVGIADATSKVKRATVQAGLCCSTDVTVDCLLLTDVDIPFCYVSASTPRHAPNQTLTHLTGRINHRIRLLRRLLRLRRHRGLLRPRRRRPQLLHRRLRLLQRQHREHLQPSQHHPPQHRHAHYPPPHRNSRQLAPHCRCGREAHGHGQRELD